MGHRLWLSSPLHVEANAECTLFKRRELILPIELSSRFISLLSPLVTCHLFFFSLLLLSKSLHGILPLA